MQIKHKLKLMFTENYLNEDIVMKCKTCRHKTVHKEHGFRSHNYRLTCTECGEINYYEYQ